MKERYIVLKGIYKDYLILIYKNHRYHSFGDDKIILKYFRLRKLKNINTIKIYNLEIKEIKEYSNNNYQNYLLKAMLCEKIKLGSCKQSQD